MTNNLPTKPGDEVNGWNVIERVEKPGDKYHDHWLCRCRCGTERVLQGSKLRAGRWQSCGCVFVTHHLPKWMKELRRTWHSMLNRCRNPRNPGYPRYGGRGIAVCEEWQQSFEKFCTDMGPRPSPDHSIDRIDNDGNYAPGNCRWAAVDVQARNKTTTRNLTINGVTKCLADWCDEKGLEANLVLARLDRGWTPEAAILTPRTAWKTRKTGIVQKPAIRFRPRSPLTICEDTKTVSDWAKERGMPVTAVISRLNRGWDAREAIETPLKTHRVFTRAA